MIFVIAIAYFATKLNQMNSSLFYSLLKKKFPFEPTYKQDIFFQKIAIFLTEMENKTIFVLKGYAGTGKTTTISTLVTNLWKTEKKAVLLAPTGRAAKVFSHKSETDAFTIHKHIYRRKSKVDITSGLDLQLNLFKNTVFFVDEASMIGDYTLLKDGQINPRNLLEDLVEYVYSGDGCKLIL